ncbi:MAG TPA: alpha-2-macroglobulin family protein [Pyrinomonadaceae bacterium]|nr:alpha-2-macroglobulin family protein [Pyrinomonadaceae bacterium]
MMKQNRVICLVLIYAILLGSLIQPVPAQNEDSQEENQEESKGLEFRLREGEGKTAGGKTEPVSQAVKLSETETDAILRRLPPLEAETSDKADFSTLPNSLPPPKTGKIIPVKFPSEEQQKNAPQPENSAALEIVRASPNNYVPFVTDLSVTFSQPMVAVSSQNKASETVPVILTPEVKGKWRWLGTKTLIFDAAERFPMATRFSAAIPAGTRSATGGALQKDFSWNFETPPPKVEGFIPNDETVRRDAVLLAKFNQRINAEAVLPKISAKADGQIIALRLATQAEIDADKRISETIKGFVPNQWIAFRAVDLLPVDSNIGVNFEAGTPSAEGSLTSVSARGFAFRTFGAMNLTDSFCDYNYKTRACKSYEDFRIEFSNPIEAESFDKSLVKIEPKIENPEIAFYGDAIEIGGCCKEPRTTYKVKVSGALRDIYGQTLGKDASAEFKISGSDAELRAERNGSFITLDPSAKRVFSVSSTNYKTLKVKIYAVKPEDYEAFYNYRQSEKNEAPAIGKPVYDQTISIKSKRDVSEETKIDLAPAMPNGVGHAILVVEPPVITEENKNQRIIVWLQATDIGVDAFADSEQLTVYASDLKTGKPLKNVNLRFLSGEIGSTSENGLASLVSPKNIANKNWLIAQNGADSAILFGENYYNSENGWTPKYKPEALHWFVFDDRKMYRPGETVSVKGYLRRIAGGKLADVEALGDAASGLNYVLRDSLGNEILRGSAELNIFGAFDLQLKLPENINLGYEKLEFSTESNLENKTFRHQFQVQEFRRPEFEVTAKNETAAPFYVGDSATVSVEAKYYSGGGLANAATNWKVTATPTDYTPPNRDDFTFGKFVRWWESYYEGDWEENTSQEFKGTTDTNGKHFLAMDFVAARPARPFTINAEARVQDVNRQSFAGSTTLLVHPSELYVGIRTPKTFIKANETFRIETITTDIDGKAVADVPVSIAAELKDWEQIKGEWQEITVDTQTCQIRSASEAVACEFKAKRGGIFTIKASVQDRKERRNESELDVWVAGGNTAPSGNIEKETVELIPDKKEYTPGETAEILVNAPFFPAEGVLTLRRNGIVKTERFTMNQTSTVLRIPVEERFLPNLHVQVDLSGAAKRIVFDTELDDKLPKRPAYASGELNLEISTASRKLNVAAEPLEKTLEPGGATSINLAVTDNNGKPAANTEVAVVAVDESVLALTGYKIPNPLDDFYPEIEAGTNDFYSRENILLANPEDLGVDLGNIGFGRGEGTGNGDGNGSGDGMSDLSSVTKSVLYAPNIAFTRENKLVKATEDANQIKLRQNFNALAIFSPSVRTDASGKAVVKINLPDNLTRYRITAVAAAANSKKFGITESAITARQPLMVRPSAPRFMNFGDTAQLPVVLQNQTNDPLTVDVAIRATNAALADGSGRRLTIAANDRAEIRFPVSAQSAGIARFQIGAVAGNFADAAEFAFPVGTPATNESFATYGTTDVSGAIVQPILAPENVFPQFGGLEITTSSTQLQELTDAFIYLQSYPFECSEQISSRILSVAALRDVLQAFEAKDLPAKAEIEAKMTSDIERLRRLQHGDGGFSFWSGKDQSIPYVSVHVAHALARAKSKGYDVPPVLSRNLQNYLKNIEGKYSEFYSIEARWAISAYALYVRNLMGDTDAAKARKLLQEAGLEKLSAESIGWLLAVLADDKDSSEQVDLIKRNLLNRVAETASAAHFVTNYKDGEYVLLSSERRADAVVLEAFLKSDPNNELIPKIVRGLLADKIKGRWRNTQENAFVLLALDKYFQTYEKVTPNFVARVWLGQISAAEQKFTGRSVDSKSINVPMQFLQQKTAAQNLILDKQGEGRLYYRIGMKYAPKNLNIDAADFGFTVMRSYEAIDQADDVTQNSDGSWAIKSGARVRVRLQMVAPTRRYHVALVDRLPAGLEIINPELANSESLPEDQQMPVIGYGYNYSGSIWYDHQNLRDDRAEIFKALLSEGVWNYSYIARATTPGDFTAPPAKAEEMYSPETFGRSRTDFVKVK